MHGALPRRHRESPRTSSQSPRCIRKPTRESRVLARKRASTMVGESNQRGAMLELLVVVPTLLASDSGPVMSTYVIGAPYSLVEVGCEEREVALEVARTYRDAGRNEAWIVISGLSKRLSSDGQAACGNIQGSFIFTSE